MADPITTENTERFYNWRNEVDTALGEKAQKSAPVNVVLLASGWTGDSEPYYQTIAVAGLGATQTAEIILRNGATEEQREAAREAMLEVYEQGEGTITIVADGEMPEIDIPATVILFG